MHPLSPPDPNSSVRDERGSVAVEFAIILPLLLALFLVIVDFGRAFNEWNDLNQVAGEGARFAAVNRGPDGTSDNLKEALQAQLDTAELREGSDRTDPATILICYDDPRPGQPVKVEISADYPLMDYVTGFFDEPPTVTIRGSATMRLEAVPSFPSDSCT